MNDELTQYVNDIKVYFSLLKESISMFKTAKELMPDSPEKDAASKYLEEAEKKAQVAETSLAKSLGFLLCPKCWPPVILRATRVSSNVDTYICSFCGTNYANHGKRNNKVNLREIVSKNNDQ